METFVNLITCGVFCTEVQQKETLFSQLFSGRITQSQTDVADVRLLGHIGAFFFWELIAEWDTYCPQHLEHALARHPWKKYDDDVSRRLLRLHAEQIIDRAYQQADEHLFELAWRVGLACQDMQRVRRHLQDLLFVNQDWPAFEELMARPEFHPSESYNDKIIWHIPINMDELMKLDKGWKCVLRQDHVEFKVAHHTLTLDKNHLDQARDWLKQVRTKLVQETHDVLVQETKADWQIDEDGQLRWTHQHFEVVLYQHSYQWWLRHRRFTYTCETLQELRQKLRQEWNFGQYIDFIMKQVRKINWQFYEYWPQSVNYVVTTPMMCDWPEDEDMFDISYCLRIYPGKVTVGIDKKEVEPGDELWQIVRSWGVQPKRKIEYNSDSDDDDMQQITKSICKRLIRALEDIIDQ